MLINLCLAPVFGAIGEYLWLSTSITSAEGAAALIIIAGVALALSLLVSWWPARRAARQDPVKALMHE